MKERIIEIVELGQPKSLIQRENSPITELIKTDMLIEELNEQLRLYNVSNLLCSSFDPDTTTSSATKCKCGREKWEHPKTT